MRHRWRGLGSYGRAVQLGVCVRDIAVADVVGLAREAEGLGYSHLYLPEGSQIDNEARLAGRDPFVTLAAVFEATSTLIGAVGVAQAIFQRMPQLALRAGTLAEQSGGRFDLGIGVSHREIAARFEVAFPTSPLATLRHCLDELKDWRGRLRFGNDFAVLVGALGPKMVTLGAGHGDGVVLNWLTPATARTTVATVKAVTGPYRKAQSVLYIRVGTAMGLRPDAIGYDQMANYHRHFVAQGLTDPDAVVAGTCLDVDDIGAMRAAIATYDDAGIDVLCLYLHGHTPPERRRILAAIAHR